MADAAQLSGARRAVLREVPFGSPAYHACAALRDRYLRRPLGLVQTAEDLHGEDSQIHLAAMVGDDLVVGTAILKPLDPARAKLRQMVVSEEARGSGLGRDLVRFAETIARERGMAEIELNARLVAKGFYETLGYAPVGDLFTEVGIPHVRMVRRLPG